MSCCTAKDNLIFKVIDISKLNSSEPQKINKRASQLQILQSRPFDESTLSNNNIDGKLATHIHQVYSSTELNKLCNPLSSHQHENTEENENDSNYQRPRKTQTEKFDLKKLMPKFKKSTTSVMETSKISFGPAKTMNHKRKSIYKKDIEVINDILNEKQIALIKTFLFQGSNLIDQIGGSIQ